MPRAPRRFATGPALMGLLATVLLALVAGGCARTRSVPSTGKVVLLSGAAPADVALIEPLLQEGLPAVSQRLDLPWLEPLRAEIVPNRAAFTASFPLEYGMPETECWMVAWAIADRLVVLSPGAWRGPEVCEHDPDDRVELALLLRHELVHALHGQHNPTRDFTGMENELGWFIEGLATYASGQLEHGHADDARQAIAAGEAPARLAVAWRGRYRYGVCGSLVAYLEQRCGPERLGEMLAATTQEQLLQQAGLSERELLAAWRVWASG